MGVMRHGRRSRDVRDQPVGNTRQDVGCRHRLHLRRTGIQKSDLRGRCQDFVVGTTFDRFQEMPDGKSSDGHGKVEIDAVHGFDQRTLNVRPLFG